MDHFLLLSQRFSYKKEADKNTEYKSRYVSSTPSILNLYFHENFVVKRLKNLCESCLEIDVVIN